MSANTSQQGFTLVEMVVTMVISVVVVGFVAVFISGPVAGFTDQARRAGLSDAADGALNRLVRDVRRALPNSIRITNAGGVQALELISSVDGARYRRSPPGSNLQILDFGNADDAFNTIGSFTQISKPFISNSHYLVIYNVGVTGADAYALTDVITPPGTQIAITNDVPAGEDRVALTPGFRFAYESPRQRLFLVDTPVTYLCDTGAATLRRYVNYPIAVSQADRDTAAELLAAGADTTLLADQITTCGFGYTAGTAERAALVTISLGVGAQGENVALLRQVHVDNAP